MRIFTVILLLLTLSACRYRSETQEKIVSPFHFSGYCQLDWQHSGEMETAAILETARMEQQERSGYFSVMSHLGTADGVRQPESIQNDMRLKLLDRAVCFMTAELFPQYVPVFAESRRRAGCIEVLANIREYKSLENSGEISAKEQEEFEMLLLYSGSAMDINMRNIAEFFDYSTLPQYERKNVKTTLPEWLCWKNDTPLLWAKLLSRLPQEILRSPGVDRRKTALYAMKISRTVARKTVDEHMVKLQKKEKINSGKRAKYRSEYERSLAYAWQIRFPEPVNGENFKREEQFISDLWLLMQ